MNSVCIQTEKTCSNKLLDIIGFLGYILGFTQAEKITENEAEQNIFVLK